MGENPFLLCMQQVYTYCAKKCLIGIQVFLYKPCVKAYIRRMVAMKDKVPDVTIYQKITGMSQKSWDRIITEFIVPGIRHEVHVLIQAGLMEVVRKEVKTQLEHGFMKVDKQYKEGDQMIFVFDGEAWIKVAE